MSENLICIYCGKICKTNQSKSYHQNRCKCNPNRKIEIKPKSRNPKTICNICGKQIVNCNIGRHLEAHNYCSKDKTDFPDDLSCKFCGKKLKNKKSYSQHVIRCKDNPNRINVIINNFNSAGRIPWNKGLSKETDDRVLAYSKNLSDNLLRKVESGWLPIIATEEYWNDINRKIQSERKKKLYESHPEKHPNRKLSNNKTRMSFPELITYNVLQELHQDFIHQYKTESFDNQIRYVDFYLPNYNLYIEVDGEFWHKNCKEKDRNKDMYALNNQKIKTLRISAKNNIRKTLQDILHRLKS